MNDDTPAPEEDEDLDATLAELTAQAAALAVTEPGTGLATTATSAVDTKRFMAAKRGELVRIRSEIDRVRSDIERQMRAKLWEIDQVMAPMKAQVALLEEGINAVNLYLGRDEDLVQLVEGQPATADTPITVRQLVLYMDEECAVAAEDGGIDATKIGSFDDWLLSDPAHLDQVLPETRGIVALQARRRTKDYNDPFVNRMMADANAQTYWLIRNGECVYRTTTDFQVGKHLIPPRDEFTSFFLSHDGTPLEPGTSAWKKAEESADARKRHFMRSALILQGLLDRTAVLAPLPAEGVSFLQPHSYDEGHVVIVTDAELTIGDGHQPFKKWLQGLQQQLRPGMRITGSFHASAFSGQWNDNSEHRIYPETASRPESNVIHYLDEKADDGWKFRYTRTDKIWVEAGYDDVALRRQVRLGT